MTAGCHVAHAFGSRTCHDAFIGSQWPLASVSAEVFCCNTADAAAPLMQSMDLMVTPWKTCSARAAAIAMTVPMKMIMTGGTGLQIHW